MGLLYTPHISVLLTLHSSFNHYFKIGTTPYSFSKLIKFNNKKIPPTPKHKVKIKHLILAFCLELGVK